MPRVPFFQRQFTFSGVIRFFIIAMILVAAGFAVNYLRNVLLPFALAALVAYILEPLVNLNRRWLHTRGRGLPVLVTLLEITAVIVGLGMVFVPMCISEGQHIYRLIQEYQAGDIHVHALPDELHNFLHKYLNTEYLGRFISGGHIESVVVRGTSFLQEVIEILTHTIEWLLTFIYIIFIMIDYESLERGLKMSIPPHYRQATLAILNDIRINMDHYFRGQGAIALCAAVFYSIGFYIAGLPMAIIMGLLVGILYMIPYFQYVTLIPVTILCLLDSLTGGPGFWTELGKCLLVYVCSQCICDYILTPRIMGKALGLNPALILLALSVWGSLLGLIGMIIALPLTALGISYYQRYVIGQYPRPETAQNQQT